MCIRDSAYWVGYLASYYYWRKLQGMIARGEITGETEGRNDGDTESGNNDDAEAEFV